jgi:hypothetical protein
MNGPRRRRRAGPAPRSRTGGAGAGEPAWRAPVRTGGHPHQGDQRGERQPSRRPEPDLVHRRLGGVPPGDHRRRFRDQDIGVELGERARGGRRGDSPRRAASRTDATPRGDRDSAASNRTSTCDRPGTGGVTPSSRASSSTWREVSWKSPEAARSTGMPRRSTARRTRGAEVPRARAAAARLWVSISLSSLILMRRSSARVYTLRTEEVLSDRSAGVSAWRGRPHPRCGRYPAPVRSWACICAQAGILGDLAMPHSVQSSRSSGRRAAAREPAGPADREHRRTPAPVLPLQRWWRRRTALRSGRAGPAVASRVIADRTVVPSNDGHLEACVHEH